MCICTSGLQCHPGFHDGIRVAVRFHRAEEVPRVGQLLQNVEAITRAADRGHRSLYGAIITIHDKAFWDDQRLGNIYSIAAALHGTLPRINE